MFANLLLSVGLACCVGLGAVNNSTSSNTGSYFNSILTDGFNDPSYSNMGEIYYVFYELDENNLPFYTGRIHYSNSTNCLQIVSSLYHINIVESQVSSYDFLYYLDYTSLDEFNECYLPVLRPYDKQFLAYIDNLLDDFTFINSSVFCLTSIMQEVATYFVDFNYDLGLTDNFTLFIDYFSDTLVSSAFNSIGTNCYWREVGFFFDDPLYFDYGSFNEFSFTYSYAKPLPRYDVSTSKDYYQCFTYCDNFFPNDDNEWDDSYFPLYIYNDIDEGDSIDALYGYQCRYHFEFNYDYELRCPYFFCLPNLYEVDYSSYFNIGTYYFNTSYSTGYDNGYFDGQNIGYSNGYQSGYNAGSQQSGMFWSLFGGIADTPILMLRSLFNFDLFGVNVFAVVLSLITGVIVIWIIRKFV